MAKLEVSKADLAKDLTGKVVVVTGGNSGIGKSTCLQLSKQGATVVVGCRRLERGNVVAALCNDQEGSSGTTIAMAIDVADFASIESFVTEFKSKFTSLDILVNNAGIMNVPKNTKTKEGFESQFGTNHLGHFVLTGSLLPVLQATEKSRVVCLSSAFHNVAMGKKGYIDFEDPNYNTRSYNGWEAYAQSKLANLLFAKEMAKRYPSIVTVSLHPGFVESNLIKGPWIAKLLLHPVFKYYMKQIRPWEGVQTSLHACLNDNLENGKYYSYDGSPRGCVGGWPCKESEISKEVTDENAQKLWEMSVKLTKMDY